MHGFSRPFHILFLVLLGCATTPVSAAPLRFFATGDAPYAPAEIPPLQRLFAAAITQRTPFLVHIGDIKDGSTPCTDASLKDIAELFRAQPVPVVYTPGDNEWTDCHREKAGGFDPRERLARLRDVFFEDPEVLRLAALGVSPLDRWDGVSTYPEIYSFLREQVLFVALHVVGSDNGYREDDPAAIAEFERRDKANLDALRHATRLANARGARAMVLLFHANPHFHKTRSPHGFDATRRALVQLMAEYAGPVLLIHGDTHSYKHDRPLIDPGTGQPFARFVRAEVPGSPVVGGIWVSVDPDADEPFDIEEVYPMSLDALGES
ncbi:hypothetical protein CCR95_20380 [Thiocystis minor]|uniref:metallophosphoesterase family protein n=1 Tax=Thiocystis minor TaxID=61597 RepID=UPI0019135457|nr:metallophosphoesterase family protein [Thiocystis minor]MBK5966375.1 hypothetical protein [Thiocystis minor]